MDRINIELIKPIDKNVAHKICSDQVILSLSMAVKELVENSIDAGATAIDIKLKEFGSECIEVSDNGCGLLKENFHALTLPHYTSKIKEFSDLESLHTLGFRGEALSSLCTVADLTITTKHKLSEHASRIKYDQTGSIISEVILAREVGTSVTLENLFAPLPVRRKELAKNLKREFNKMCQLLYAYCLVSKGIKFTCTNMTGKGKKNVVVATQGFGTVKENIIGVFDAKQISNLVDVEFIDPNEEIMTEYGINHPITEESPFEFEFFISSAVHGSGRSTPDRQFYFINSRPVEPHKIIKLINEIYKQYNSNQYPFVYLNIITKSGKVDVNVTPDKRQIFLEKEKYLMASIKSSLIEMFKMFPSTLKLQNTHITKSFSSGQVISESNTKGIKRSSTCPEDFLDKYRKKSKTQDNSHNDYTKQTFEKKENNFDSLTSLRKQFSSKGTILEKFICSQIKKIEKPVLTVEEILTEQCETDSKENIEKSFIISDENSSKFSETITKLDNIQSCVPDCAKTIVKKTVKIKFDIKQIKEILNNTKENNCTNIVKVKFRSKIAPEDNNLAENELKQLSKSEFKSMEILGQFNLGFIVTKLENDLFLIDQHATDEKYNFEQLQASTVLSNQHLVKPKSLELTAGNEALLIENEEIFNKNGFSFKIDNDAPCTKKVYLTTVPMSQNYTFGKNDIDEMLFMLQDSSQTLCRPSKVRSMFASRACRKSVMIGQYLSKADMKNLVEHMGEIDQPWNCPHGRPTIRHLVNLGLLNEQ